jgi:hypothetical protein
MLYNPHHIRRIKAESSMLDYVALGILIFASVTVFYGIIAIHDIPYEISVHRNHPHQDAIHYAGWVSLFTLHVLWPFLWIWATLYREDRGWGFDTGDDATGNGESLQAQLASLHERLERLEQASAQPVAEKDPPQQADQDSA